MTYEYIQGIDFGGTNLRIGRVNPETGEIIGEVFKQPMAQVASDEELADIASANLTPGMPVGISAAGNVDEENLIITQSPNSSLHGEIYFGAVLKKRGFDVVMTNDMKAAAQGAARFGEGREYGNVLAATYSSGFNCAVVRDGINVTDAEFGHMTYDFESGLQCGCGGVGHLELFVSGNGAAKMARNHLSGITSESHPILVLTKERTGASGKNLLKLVSAEDVFKAFRLYPDVEPQKSIREKQVVAIARSFGMMNCAYRPIDIMVLMGSQTKDWDILFEPAIKKYHNEILQLSTLPFPIIKRTEMPEIGVQGAAAYFLQKHF
jgi:predicted NBD/HSP70 family sugar kinase